MDNTNLVHHDSNGADADGSFMTSFTTDNNDSEDDDGDSNEDSIKYIKQSPSKHRQFFPLIVGNMTFGPESEDEDEDEGGGESGDQVITVVPGQSVARRDPVLAGAPDNEDDVEDLDTEDDNEQDPVPTRASPRRAHEPNHEDDADDDGDNDEDDEDEVQAEIAVAQDETVAQRTIKTCKGPKKRYNSSLCSRSRDNVTVDDH